MGRVGSPLLHSRECSFFVERPSSGPAVGEHAVEEQHDDDLSKPEVSAALAASKWSSEKSMLMMRKNCGAPIHSSNQL